MPDFDALICLKSADSAVLPYAIEGIQAHAKPHTITIIAARSTIAQCQSLPHARHLRYIDEDTLYSGLSLERIQSILARRIHDTKRAGWYLQQFLKMAYASYKLIGGGGQIQNLARIISFGIAIRFCCGIRGFLTRAAMRSLKGRESTTSHILRH